jgi:uncharacterized protein (DUF1330 family)
MERGVSRRADKGNCRKAARTDFGGILGEAVMSTLRFLLLGLAMLATPALAQEAAATAPKAYIVAEIEVIDAATYEGYKAAVGPMVAKYGGRYLVRGGTVEAIDGAEPRDRVIVLEFPSLAAAQTFLRSDEYRPVAAIRHNSTTSRLFVVEGMQ